MRATLLLVFFIPMRLFAQDTIKYSEFRFTLVDVAGRDLTSDQVMAVVRDVFYTDTTKEDLDYVFTKLEYSKKDECWILAQNDPMGYNYRIDIYRNSDSVNQKLIDLRKMTLVYPGFDAAFNSGCQYCVCNDIPFRSGEFGIDIPKHVESWLYIRKVDINIHNTPVEFRDISDIQNWNFRTGKK